MPKRSSIAAVLAAAALFGLPGLLAAQEDGYPFRWSNFRIEASGTWAGISPESLNRAVDYENAYLAHYYLGQYAYYDDLYGDAYAASFAYAGDQAFARLDRVAPISIALRYQASPTFGLSLGLERIRGVRTSGVALDVLGEDGRADTALPGASTAHYENRDLTISVESWMPYVAANFGWDLFKPLRTEIYIKGGPIFGDLRIWNQRLESVTAGGETLASGSRTMEMTGTSTSLAIEAGGQLRIRLLPFAEIYGQAGYAFRQLNQISGLNSIAAVTTLPSASEISSAVAGTWGVTWEKATSPWGSFSAPTLTTSYNTSGRSTVGTTTAAVDLSGLQLGVGLSIRL